MPDTTRAVPQVQKLNYNGEDIGMGFNSDTGLAVGTALEFSVPNGDLAQEVQSDVSIITSHEELISKMNLSAQLEGHYAIISAGGKTDFEKSTSYNSSSTFVMARSVVSNTVTRGKDFKLKDAADTVLKQSSDAFHTAFGDSFVRAHYNGGEFYAVMRITSVDAKTESKLAVSAHASVQAGVGGGSFQLDLNEANSNSNTQSDFSVSFYQKGGAGENEIGATLSIEEITKRLHSFPEAVKNHAYPYFIEVATYDTIPLPLDAKLQQEAFLDCLQDAEKQKLDFLQSRNDCSFAAEHPEFFIDPPPAATLRDLAETFTQLYNAVLAHALAVAHGSEAPLLFDPGKLNPPIVIPTLQLQKKDLGVLASFVELWVNKDKPGTTRDEHLLIKNIGTHFASSLLGFYEIKDPSGNSDATLRLQGQALGKVLGSARDFDYSNLFESSEPYLLESLASLPQMLPANVRSLAFRFNNIATTAGLDQFRALAKLDMTWNSLESIQELASLALLKDLDLTANQVSDLGPLSSCTLLETLNLSGNQITDLTPLAACKSLKALTLVGGVAVLNGETRSTGNPIANALPLASIPGMANPFTLGNTLKVRIGKLSEGPDKQFIGTATRIGTSHQFKAHLTCGDQTADEIWTVQLITALAPPFSPLSLFDFILKPGDVPSSGTLVNIFRDAALSFSINYCFVSAEGPHMGILDLNLYPVFKTFSISTVDATVVS